MRLPKFDYRKPNSVEEACSILQGEPDAKLLAGGTDLLVNMKHGVEKPPLLVGLRGLSELNYIRKGDGALRIGALTPLKAVSKDEYVVKEFPCLAQAASSVGSYHHQTMGVIGGNLCQQTRCKFYNQSKWWRNARPICFKAGGETCHVAKKDHVCYSTYCGDVAPALLVLDAEVVLTGQSGSRRIPLERIFSGEGKTPRSMGHDEILTEIVIQEESAGAFSTYKKCANRASIDFPIVGAAVWRSQETGESRVALTAVHRKPVRALQLEDFLKGKDIAEETLQAVDGLVGKESRLMMSSIDSLSYKRTMMAVLVKSGLTEAAGGR